VGRQKKKKLAQYDRFGRRKLLLAAWATEEVAVGLESNGTKGGFIHLFIYWVNFHCV